MMTVEDVLKRVEAIKNIAGDDECAHSAEDSLWEDVLVAIAQGAPNAQELARVALNTTDIELERWYG